MAHVLCVSKEFVRIRRLVYFIGFKQKCQDFFEKKVEKFGSELRILQKKPFPRGFFCGGSKPPPYFGTTEYFLHGSPPETRKFIPKKTVR